MQGARVGYEELQEKWLFVTVKMCRKKWKKNVVKHDSRLFWMHHNKMRHK